MRLIDADYMKKAIEQFFVREKYYNPRSRLKSIPKDEALDIIDSAPTVEPCLNCEDKRQAEYIRQSSSWHELQSLRKFKAEHEKPQGKWVEFKYGLYYCSRCFERVDKDIERIDALVSKGERSNYCPCCGADMRGDNDDG